MPLSPWEQNQNKWSPFHVGVAVCDGDYEEHPQFKNYCSSRTQTLFANMFNWKKSRTSATPCQNVQVWNMEDSFHSIHQIFHFILEPLHIPYRFFPSIPYHSMPCSRRPRQCILQVNENTLQQVETFKYLGVVITSDRSHNKEIDSRIDKANAVLHELHCSVFMKRELSKTAKLLVFKSVFVPILTFGNES